ncbi:hypothetical protein Dimus_018103, partial [Dionaea muscipula]
PIAMAADCNLSPRRLQIITPLTGRRYNHPPPTAHRRPNLPSSPPLPATIDAQICRTFKQPSSKPARSSKHGEFEQAG